MVKRDLTMLPQNEQEDPRQKSMSPLYLLDQSEQTFMSYQ